MFEGAPNAQEISAASRTTTGTLLTVPAGKWYTGNLSMTAATGVAGTCAPTVAVAGTGSAPTAGAVVGRLTVIGVSLLGPVADSNDTEILLLAPDGNDITLEFTAGAVGSSSATINGYIFG
jgi:hypothetical protein